MVSLIDVNSNVPLHDKESEELAEKVVYLYESLDSSIPVDTVRQNFKSMLSDLTLRKIWDVYNVLMQKVVESGKECQFADVKEYHDAAEYLLTFVSIPGGTEQNSHGLDGVVGQSRGSDETHRKLILYILGREPIIFHYRGLQRISPYTT